eukprot:CAMPEP_0197073140 /NCGR_PEP_ID=MMETSP1384-20130603/210454_1 /TAXON_ID=29189 /ORGANISM="Ammonia sp." /LENGTH=410 /DNA_ID=CAMNT_0042511971 /DNA_START=26 /DNA_END=1258 /DNA_ORIENTATION=-
MGSEQSNHSRPSSQNGSNKSVSPKGPKLTIALPEVAAVAHPTFVNTGSPSGGIEESEDIDPSFTPRIRTRRNTLHIAPKTPSKHRANKSSLYMIQNGITGTYVSYRICKIVARFWKQNVDSLTVDQQLEVGTSIFCTMLSSDFEMKKVLQKNLVTENNEKIEKTSLKYLDMIGWLVRYLVTDNIDLCSILSRLGTFHQKMGIQLHHFNPMLQAMHESFSYYFKQKYTIDVKYAFDEIFTLCAQFMTGESLNGGRSPYLLKINEQFQQNVVPFLQDLDTCLGSGVGQDYLYRYLQQTWCDEIVIFLKTSARFKCAVDDKDRIALAVDIKNTCIKETAEFALNLSYMTRINTLKDIEDLEAAVAAKEPVDVSLTLFDQVEAETLKLVQDNHWSEFKQSISILQMKSAAATEM